MSVFELWNLLPFVTEGSRELKIFFGRACVEFLRLLTKLHQKAGDLMQWIDYCSVNRVPPFFTELYQVHPTCNSFVHNSQESFKVNSWVLSQGTAHVPCIIPVSFLSCRTKDIQVYNNSYSDFHYFPPSPPASSGYSFCPSPQITSFNVMGLFEHFSWTCQLNSSVGTIIWRY